LYFALCLAPCCLCTGCASPFSSGSQTSLARFEQRQVFRAARYPNGNWTPAAFKFEDAWFHAEDGTRLNGWYSPHENPAGVVLLAHGNSGNMTAYADALRVLHDRHRLSIMVFDYRGYGKSEGEPDEHGILEDARAARQWLAQRANIPEHDVVLMGHSLGGGVVVDLAAADGARGLILVNTFTSLPDVAAHHLPLVPARLIMHNRFDSISKIENYHGPLLQAHCETDRTIPITQGKRLFAKANEPKHFVATTGTGHDDLLPEDFQKSLDDFLASLPGTTPLPKPARWHAAGSRSSL
jgi:fermentation-respiration switch protein FrsA (DUF1100 family)